MANDEQNVREIKMENEKDILKFFKSVDVKLTNVSLYSTTPVSQSVYTMDIIKSYYSKEELKKLSIFDASACIGGNTWSFCEKFEKVYANEINKVNYEALCYNLKGYSNVQFFNEDFLSIKDKVKSDLIFLDCPWNGVDYKTYYSNVGYNNIDIIDIIDMITVNEEATTKEGDNYDMIIMKLPNEYSWNMFSRYKDRYKYINEYNIRTKNTGNIYKIIIMTNRIPKSSLKHKYFKRLGYKYFKYL